MISRAFRAVLDRHSFLPSLFPDRPQLQNIGYLIAGNGLKLALGLITGALAYRALGPASVGRLALALSVVGLFAMVKEFGLRDAALNYIARYLPTAPQQAYAVARTFLLSKTFLSALAAAAAFFSAGLIAARFYPQADIAALLRLGAFSLFAEGLLGFSLVVLEAQRDFRMVGALSMVQALVRAGLIVSLFLARRLSLSAMLIIESAVPLTAFVCSLRLVRPFVALHRPWFTHGRALLRFTKWIAVAVAASTIFSKLDVLMLSTWRSTAEVGMYAAALALVGRLDILKNAVLTTSFPEACRRTAPDDLRAFVGRSLRLTGLASLATLPLFGIGGVLIVWLYGAAYAPATLVFYPLLVAFIIGLNTEPAAYVLYPLERPRWIAAGDLLQLAFHAAANLVLIPRYGFVGAAWAVLLRRSLGALITTVLLRRFLWGGEHR